MDGWMVWLESVMSSNREPHSKADSTVAFQTNAKGLSWLICSSYFLESQYPFKVHAI